MKVSKKIKLWARIGQLSFWLYMFAIVAFDRQLPMHEAIEFSETDLEVILVCTSFSLAVLLSEAIVRVIGYFAEIFEK